MFSNLITMIYEQNQDLHQINWHEVQNTPINTVEDAKTCLKKYLVFIQDFIVRDDLFNILSFSADARHTIISAYHPYLKEPKIIWLTLATRINEKRIGKVSSLSV